jgi:hypothetical protein
MGNILFYCLGEAWMGFVYDPEDGHCGALQPATMPGRAVTKQRWNIAVFRKLDKKN